MNNIKKFLTEAFGARQILMILSIVMLAQSYILAASDFTVNSYSFVTGTKGLSGTLFQNSALDVVTNTWDFLSVRKNANFSPLSEVFITTKALGQPKLLTEPLFYPNPFQLASGSKLGYRLDLDSDKDIQIRIYDMRANEIARKTLPIGTQGTLGLTYNKVSITAADFNNFQLSSGAYFFVILYGNKTLLARGKFAIVP